MNLKMTKNVCTFCHLGFFHLVLDSAGLKWIFVYTDLVCM